LILGLLLAALTSACKKAEPAVDPFYAALTSYKQAVEPPIQKSEELQKVFVQIVLDDKGSPDPDRAAQRMQQEILPRAQEFLDQVKAVQPTEKTLQDLHAVLVAAATLRQEGYKLILDGFAQKNLDTFTQGQKKVTESKIQEENYISQTDQLMNSYGLELSYFAAPPAVSP
jgi:hypothetical protein